MGTEHADELHKWVNGFDDALAVLHKKYGDPIRLESSGEGAVESSPRNAENAAEVLRQVREGLEDLSAVLLTEDLDRQSYWQGPAAKVFGDTIKVYREYFAELTAMIKLYEVATGDKVATNHKAALNDFEEALNGADGLRAQWGAVGTKYYGLALRMARTMDADGRRHQTFVDAYNTHLRRYREEAEAVYQASATRFAKIWADLNPVYQSAVVDYKPLPGPDFSTVKASGVDQDKAKDGPDSGPPAPDLTSKDLPDLGGPGGGMPDLSGGNGPDLSGGGGQGDLGAGGLSGLGGAGGLSTGPDGTRGLDVTGNGRPDLDPAGVRLPGGDLPAGARVVRRPDGSKGIDLNGDGVADVDMDGRAVPGGSAPHGSRLVTGPDGTTGYDITGNNVPDLDLDLQPLAGGDLPAGSRAVSGGIDLNGDGTPDVSVDGRSLPGSGAPTGGRLATGPDGRTGFDTNGDGVPDVGFDGRPMSSDPTGSPDPTGRVPGDQVRQVAGGDSDGSASSGTGAGGPLGTGYPPPIPPAVGAGAGGGNSERERQTWLQEDDEVWADDLAPISALGRPADEEDEEDVIDEWAAPPRRPRGASRPQRPTQGSWPAGLSRG